MNYRVQSNRDGVLANRGGSFRSAQPGSYSIINELDETVGSIEAQDRFPLSLINKSFCGYGRAWVAYIDGRRVFVAQRLSTVREHVINR